MIGRSPLRHPCGLLLAVLALAAFLRLPVPEPPWLHADEHAFILYPLGFWGGDLNPHFFNYPTLQFYLVSVVDRVYYALAGAAPLDAFIARRYFVAAPDLIAIARGVTTAMAVATVAVTARLGARLYGPWGGLLAAGILAVLPLHARFSHLAATDVPAALWTTLALLSAVRVCQRGRTRDLVAAGVCVGLAAGTKYPGVLAAVPVAAACLLRWRALRPVALAAAAAAATFALVSPYVLLDAGAAWQALAHLGDEHLLGDVHRAGAPPLHFLTHTLRHGLGPGALAVVVAALAWRPLALRRDEIVLVAGVAALALLPAFAPSAFMRYAVPLAPALAVLAVRPLALARLPRWAVAGGVVAVLAPPAYASLQARALLCRPDTRTLALAWIGDRVEGGVRYVLPTGNAGDPGLLTPQDLLERERHFAASFGADGLLRAYRLLASATDPTPPFGARVALDLDAAPPAGDGTPGDVLLCWSQHPLCAASPPRWLGDPRIAWVASFAAGQPERAEYDPADWYFLPVAGAAHVTATGPSLRLAWLRLAIASPVPSARQFYQLRLHTLEADHAVAQRRWDEARRHQEAVLERGFVLQELFPPAVLRSFDANLAATRAHPSAL